MMSREFDIDRLMQEWRINGFVVFCVDDLDLWHAESKLQLGFSGFVRRLLMPDIRANVN